MKRIVLLILVAFIAFVGWRITESISSDALGLAIGVVFGVLAGLPTALLVLASNRRSESERGGQPRGQQPMGQMGYGPQAPVIVLASPGMQPQQALSDPAAAQAPPAAQNPWPQHQQERQFQFIGGEQEGVFDG
jgi:hypothetical protein